MANDLALIVFFSLANAFLAISGEFRANILPLSPLFGRFSIHYRRFFVVDGSKGSHILPEMDVM